MRQSEINLKYCTVLFFNVLYSNRILFKLASKKHKPVYSLVRFDIFTTNNLTISINFTFLSIFAVLVVLKVFNRFGFGVGCVLAFFVVLDHPLAKTFPYSFLPTEWYVVFIFCMTISGS